MEDATALTEQITSDDKNLQLTSTSSWPVVFAEGDEDDSLFFADSSGLYRYSFKGSVVEQVIDGSLNSIGSPDTYLVSMESDKDGNFYLAVTDGVSGRKASEVCVFRRYSRNAGYGADRLLSQGQFLYAPDCGSLPEKVPGYLSEL